MKIEALGAIRDFIIASFAAHVEAKQLRKDLIELFDKSYSLKYLSAQKSRFKVEIAEKRKELNQNVQEIPIANLYWRLQRRQEMLEAIKATGYRQGTTSLYQTANAIMDSTGRELADLTSQGWEGTLIGLMQMSAQQFRERLQAEAIPGRFLECTQDSATCPRSDEPGQGDADAGGAPVTRLLPGYDAAGRVDSATGAPARARADASTSELPTLPVATQSTNGSHPIEDHPSLPLFEEKFEKKIVEKRDNFLELVGVVKKGR